MLRTIGGVLLCAVMAAALSAQTLKPLVTFNGTNGNDPFASLTYGSDGNLYGTTVYGGNADSGIVFSISPEGAQTILYNFCQQPGCTDGAYPEWLTQASDGNLYGETYNGGSAGAGTIFKITTSGQFTTLYSFCALANCADGALPQSALVQTSDGSFYGTTVIGGSQNQGTVFKFANGALTTLYNFCIQSNCADGAQPNIGLTLASDGNFYGTAALGGKPSPECLYRCGTLFRITPGGQFTLLYSFCAVNKCPDGAIPQGLLVQARDGSLYGTTDGGGANKSGIAFKVTPKGKFTTLHSFCTGTCQDGAIPYAGLIQATDGNFYGTTNLEGPGGFGTVYKMTPSGVVTSLWGFDGGSDGAFPVAGVIQGNGAVLYGATEQGGDVNCSSLGCGVVFQLSAKADNQAASSGAGYRAENFYLTSKPMPISVVGAKR